MQVILSTFFLLLGFADNYWYFSMLSEKFGCMTTDRLHGMLKMNISKLVLRAVSMTNGNPSMSADSLSVVRLIRVCRVYPEGRSPILIGGLSGLSLKALELNLIAKPLH